MAQKGVQLDRETFSCPICLDLLKDPVTTSCGHSYCMDCIKTHWDKEDVKKVYSCPQCRQSFKPRPVLLKNTMLADLVEELKKTGLQAAPADHCYAGAGDVACDFCTGRKLRACKSCLQCLASYCDKHLQPHHDSATFKKHKLVEPSKKLQENICSRHDEVMKLFCRTDQQSICSLCSVDEHKGHDTVSAAAERTERQKEIKVRRLNIQQRIHSSREVMKQLQQEVDGINRSADKDVKNSEKIFIELIRFIQKKSSDVRQKVKSQQESEVRRVKEFQKKLEQEMAELKKKDSELELLQHTDDHTQLLEKFSSVSPLGESSELPSPKIRPLQYFEDVTTAVSEVRDKLQEVLMEKWPKILRTVTEVDAFLSQQLRTREEFLRYASQITLDPNSSNTSIMLFSERYRKVTTTPLLEMCFPSRERFNGLHQVLSRESLTGRCYFEVEYDALLTVAVAYKDMQRHNTSKDCAFGYNEKSWALFCHHEFEFRHDDIHTPISVKSSYKVGVFLDHKAGVLSFYDVGETMKFIHKVQTTFTQPLYAGLALHFSNGDNATVCELK
ncbi:tripartite motif-containing protein 16-like [Notothenia coriiceps]|uniref:Tripartite motif-containing protein 16-like n=1 Tax=Notothenia coriiceps TaxID=8208 RepID=A0A6I9PDT2_9TELE|nr:PREDICTED: tripartite motif-containing protein 16-like [Notothenia coriiceps]